MRHTQLVDFKNVSLMQKHLCLPMQHVRDLISCIFFTQGVWNLGKTA